MARDVDECEEPGRVFGRASSNSIGNEEDICKDLQDYCNSMDWVNPLHTQRNATSQAVQTASYTSESKSMPSKIVRKKVAFAPIAQTKPYAGADTARRQAVDQKLKATYNNGTGVEGVSHDQTSWEPRQYSESKDKSSRNWPLQDAPATSTEEYGANSQLGRDMNTIDNNETSTATNVQEKIAYIEKWINEVQGDISKATKSNAILRETTRRGFTTAGARMAKMAKECKTLFTAFKDANRKQEKLIGDLTLRVKELESAEYMSRDDVVDIAHQIEKRMANRLAAATGGTPTTQPPNTRRQTTSNDRLSKTLARLELNQPAPKHGP